MCTLNIVDFKSVEACGIKGILSFDDNYITLELDNKYLIIEGNNLKVDSLLKESGKISIKGDFLSFEYKDIKQKRKKGSLL